MIKFSLLKKNKISIPELSKIFYSEIDPLELFNPDRYLIAYSCLSKFNFKNLKKTNPSIEKYCLKVLNTIRTFKLSPEKPVDFFLLLFLNIKTLPCVNKLYLEKEVKRDLLEIETLLNHYYSHDFIKRYKTDHIPPRNQEEKTVLEFYKRTLRKKDSILEFLLSGIDKRALEKSKPNIPLVEDKKYEELMVKIEKHQDFPYKDNVTKFNTKKVIWDYEIDFEKIDYRKINPIKTKIGLFPFKSDITKGYSEEIKREIHLKYKKNQSDAHLNYICAKIAELPIINHRLKIFEELRSLYQGKKWYGFYALALPQIEGIFSELTTIVSSSKNSGKTLGEKAQLIRAHYENSEFAFDYYEHFLPLQRNKFSHSGTDNDIQVKSIFLLLDLVHLLSIIEDINSPLIKISNILKQGPGYFTHVGKISNFIFVIRKIEPRHLFEVQEKIYKLSNELFSSTINLKSFLDNLHKDYTSSAFQFEHYLESISLLKNRKRLKVFSLANSEISQRIEEISSLISDDMSVLFEDDLKLLFDTNYFIKGLPHIFKEIPKKISTLLLNFEQKNKETFSKINIIRAKIKPEITSDDFLLKKNEFKHIIR